MIVSVRGASGSGKTTLVRRVMDCCEVLRADDGYILSKGDGLIFVPGDYERINGGLDSMRDIETAYALAEHYHCHGMDVLMEGRGHEDGTKALLELRDEGLPVSAALIVEPLADCVAAVKKRGYYIPPPAIRRMVERCEIHHLTFSQERIPCFAGNREAVFQQVLKWLTVHTHQATCPIF